MMKISQHFAVIRYENALLFDDARTRNNLLKKLRTTFPAFDLNDQLKVMAFFDPIKKIKCLIHVDNIVVDIEEPRDLGLLKTTINDVVPFVLQELDVQETQYIGVRAHFIPGNLLTQDETETEILKKYYSTNFISFLNREHGDIGLSPRIGYSVKLDSGLQMNINISTNQNVTGEIGPNGQFHVTEVRETTPLVDLDVFTSTPKDISQINGVIKGSGIQMEKYYDKVWNTLREGVVR